MAQPVLSNPRAARVREYAKLTRRSARVKAGLFIVEGPGAIAEALAAVPTSGLRAAFMTADAAERHPEILDRAAARGVEFRECTDDVLAEMADTVHAQGMIVVCDFLDVSLESVLDARPRLVAVLSQVRDPGNAGTIVRAADAAGADAVIVTDASVDLYNSKTVRSTAGSVFHLPIVVGVPLMQIAADVRSAGLQILAADGNQPAVDLFSVDLVPPTAWVFGNEAWGLPAGDRDLADTAVAVPIYGRAESLNVAAAAAVCLYASARSQRQ
nr:RNA methyltransferase [Spelaeicoccus albus]